MKVVHDCFIRVTALLGYLDIPVIFLRGEGMCCPLNPALKLSPAGAGDHFGLLKWFSEKCLLVC